jgi:hypothetical protein
MTILGVVHDASPKLGIARPTQLMSDSGATSLDVQSVLKEAALEIAQRHDWSALKTLGTLAGNGVATTFNLPTDYDRMLKKAELWSSAAPNTPLRHYPDSDQWLGFSVQSYQPLLGGWTMLGGQFAVSPALANGATAKFYYVTRKIFADAGGTAKQDFTADTDVFRLDERLLSLL